MGTHGKLQILISDAKKEKIIAVVSLILTKSDEYFSSIVFSDETMVKAYPNGDILIKKSEFFISTFYLELYTHISLIISLLDLQIQNHVYSIP